MDFTNRGNRPLQQQKPDPAQHLENMPAAPNNKKTNKFDFSKISSIAVLFGVAILIIAVVFGLIFGNSGAVNNEKTLIMQDKYQAVFLNSQDGQVYFGKLSVYNNDLYVLRNIYYVRVENPIQPEGANQKARPNISLAKLGSELHGPEDFMYISRDKVLYWENLKDDGQVVKAIVDYEKNGEKTPEQQAPSAAGTQPAGTPQQNDTPQQPVTPPADNTSTNDSSSPQ